jgi:predicted small lipoprotein YifL
MKKKVALFLVLAMVMLALAACGGGAKEEAQAPADDNAAAGAVKTGLAVVTSTARSADAGEKNGFELADSEVVAVTVDANGTIVDCAIDSAQTTIEFTKEGKLATPVDSIFPSRQELGASYGMKAASGIGKEWNEQATALSNYVIGKTIDEVKGIAVTAEGAPKDADLASSVTIGIAPYIEAIEKAVANAQDMGASATDKLGIGVTTNLGFSADAGEKDGLAEAYSYYTATTFNADGKITSCLIDASITDVTFDKTGKITSDINAAYKTKNELGAEYGMAKASSIGKEWNEQAAAFAKYVVGKTVDEVKGIAINADGAPTADDLKASVTVHITDFTTIIEKAFKAQK